LKRATGDNQLGDLQEEGTAEIEHSDESNESSLLHRFSLDNLRFIFVETIRRRSARFVDHRDHRIVSSRSLDQSRVLSTGKKLFVLQDR